MNFVALGLYLIAATGGLIMAVRAFKGQGAPMLMAVLHFVFAGAGAGTLAAFIFTQAPAEAGLFKAALITYGLAALGGLYLFSFRFRDAGMPPKAVIAIHGAVAAVGTVLLVLASL